MSFRPDLMSAIRKLTSNVEMSVGVSAPIPIVSASVSKTFSTGPHNPQTDAYRACAKCGKHWNYHVKGKCP